MLSYQGKREGEGLMTDLYLLWSGFGPETKAALIEAIATISVGIVGFGGLIFQMRLQGRQSRDSIAENERRRLKAAMYDDAVIVCREVADKAIELGSAIRMMMLQVQYAAQDHQNGQQFNIPAASYPVLLERYGQFSDAILERFPFILVHSRRI